MMEKEGSMMERLHFECCGPDDAEGGGDEGE